VKFKQVLLILSGILLTALLYLLGPTVSEVKPNAISRPSATQLFNIESFITKQTSDSFTVNKLTQIRSAINSSNSDAEKIRLLNQAASLCKDSLKIYEAYAFYSGEAAKLDNSEKNLTFAAQLFLGALRAEHDDAKLSWESEQAISLFEKAIALNPTNDDLKIGLASCYIYGKGRNGDPQETMKGIQGLLDIVRRDSNNLKAQLVLGVGGYVSGQYDKAISRLEKIVKSQPDNIEAIAFLADSYAGKGDKNEAVKWYLVLKKMVNDPDYSNEIDERIANLNKR